MASKETQDLIVTCIDYYIENSLCAKDKRPSVDIMRVIVKLDDIKRGLTKAGDKEDGQ